MDSGQNAAAPAELESSPQKPVRPARSRKGKLLCSLIVLAALAGLSTHWLSRAYMEFDFFSNLTLQYVIVAAAFSIGHFMPRARVATGLVVLLAGLAAVAVWPRYVSDQPVTVAQPEPGARAIRVMTFNTWSRNTDWKAIAAEIRRHDPDIVTLIEFGTEKRQLLDALKPDYPYGEHCMGKLHCHLAMFSRLPLHEVKSRGVWQGPAYIRARLGSDYGGVQVFGLHSTRPPHVRSQIKQITFMSRFLKDIPGSKIVMGDFNSTPYSALLTRFTNYTGLHRQTVLPTFPARFGPFPQIAIDHVFLSDAIKPLSPARIGQNAGSDHYPVIMDVAVPGSDQ